MYYSFLADLVVVVHFTYVAFVLLGQPAILLGVALHWKWVRNPWFRFTHLAAIDIVALQAALGILCPLTVWEDHLRHLAGQPVSEASFIGRWMHTLLFYDLPLWVFTAMYIGFFLLVLVTFALAPPRWRNSALCLPRSRGSGLLVRPRD